MTFVPRRDDAEEILQRTVIALWKKFEEFDRERDFLPWALRFTYFEILSFRKELARSRLVFRDDVLAAIECTRRDVEPELERQRTALQACLRRLDADARRLLKRRYSDSETIGALAEEHGKTAKALYRKLDRIRETVARCIRQRLADQTGPIPLRNDL